MKSIVHEFLIENNFRIRRKWQHKFKRKNTWFRYVVDRERGVGRGGEVLPSYAKRLRHIDEERVKKHRGQTVKQAEIIH